VQETVQVGDIKLSVAASAGVASQEPGDAPSDLVEQAFVACRRAKSSVPGHVVGYEVAHSTEAARRERLQDDLRGAIAAGELRLVVQPIIDLGDGGVRGVEALIRWQHPVDGLLAPATFLPIADSAGLMVAIGDWVLSEAIRLAGALNATHRDRPLRMWVNLAAQQLVDGDHFLRLVRDALTVGAITADVLGFEVTESGLLEDLPAAVLVLSALRELGFPIALDDFGTGYSSLSYLRQLPVTKLKIDRSFVRGIGTGSLADEAIVEGIIDLAHALGLQVVAEGVEEPEQVDTLIRMGADMVQGYLYGKPGDLSELESVLGLLWAGHPAPAAASLTYDRRAEDLPGMGSPRARLLLTALDAAHDSIVLTRSTGGEVPPVIVYVNNAFEVETGFTARDVVGRPIDIVLPADRDASMTDWFDHVHATGTAATTEIAMTRADGTTFPCELTLSPIADERGAQTHWLHVRRDLTQRRSTEGDRNRFQGLIEQSASLVFLAETGGKWVYANAAQRVALGLDPDDDLSSVTTTDALGRTLDDIREQVWPALASSGQWSGEAAFLNRVTGDVTETISDVTMVDDPLRPGIRIFAVVSRDVTEVKRLEAQDRHRRELASFAASLAQRALHQGRDELFVDLDNVLATLGSLLGVDLAFVDTIDLDEGLLRPIGGWASARFVHGDELPESIPLDGLTEWIANLSSDAVLLNYGPETKHSGWARELDEHFPGEWRDGIILYAPLRVDRVLLGVLGLSRLDTHHTWTSDQFDTVQQVADTLANLLSRERADRSLRASEERLNAMLANTGDILIVINDDGFITFVNDRIRPVLGHEPADVVGNFFLDLVHPDDHQVAAESFAATVSGDVPPVTQVRVLDVDGRAHWYDADTSGVYDPLVGGYLISLRDVATQRAEQESAGRRAEFEQVVLGFSQMALEVESGAILPRLNHHLEHLGRALHSDTAFASFLDGDHVRNVAGWAADDTPDNAFALPDTYLPAVAARYRTLEPLVVNDIDLHDEAWAEEWRAFPVPDRAGLNVPLVSAGRCLGNIGVAMATEAREWDVDEIELVRRVSETVSALLAREQVEGSLRRSETRLAALLNGSMDLVLVVGDDGRVRYANGAVQRLLGYTPEQLVGMNPRELVHGDDIELGFERLASLFRDEPTDAPIIRLVAASGRVISFEVTTGVMTDPVAGGRVLTWRDVTARLALEAAAAARISHLRYAFDIAQDALDLEAHEFLDRLGEVCDTIAEMLGVDFVYVDQLEERNSRLLNLAGFVGNGAVQKATPGQTIPFDVVPQWVARLRKPEPIVVTDVNTGNEPWIAEKRDSLGGERSLIAMGMSAAGELFGVLGVSMATAPRQWTDDEVAFVRILAETIAHVLERARVDEALRASEARFRALSETAADVVVLLDANARIAYASPSSVGLLGLTPDQLHGRRVTSLIHPEDRRALLQAAPSVRAGGSYASELRLLRADRTPVWVANSTTAVLDPITHELLEYRVSVRDISERKRLEAELEQQALHDPLTGVGNRFLLQSSLDVASTPNADDTDLAVLLLDLDRFKEVNDTYGHAIGDEVLVIVASRLASLTRSTDTLTRTGGDEFVIVCPNTDRAAAVAIAERILRSLGGQIATSAAVVTIGASVGVSHRRGPVGDPDALLIEADHAMYAAKRAGRNQVRVSPAPR
jgi:diguanylate cyclase (GGDEF)-like protein/PAS domain S-box-containing protein